MAPHPSTLVWKTPWMEEPGALQSMGSLGTETIQAVYDLGIKRGLQKGKMT